VVVPKKNGKLKIYVDFKKFNVTTKKTLSWMRSLTPLLGMNFIPL